MDTMKTVTPEELLKSARSLRKKEVHVNKATYDYLVKEAGSTPPNLVVNPHVATGKAIVFDVNELNKMRDGIALPPKQYQTKREN